ncbi:MAG: O-antigen ligase family protein [Sulfurimonas sp.]|uniref:O-antigen ligase family protein n=1 Tax=Sulfurimonas sp. TaxID=2022749 RepID=UPI003D0DE49C
MTIPKHITFDKVVYYSVIIFSFILPLSKGLISFFLFWFFALLLYKREYASTIATLKNIPIFTYISLFLLYMIMTLFWSEDTTEALDRLRLYGYWVLVLPAMAILVKKEWVWGMLNAFLLGMFVSEILAYGIFFELWSINGKDASYPTPFMTHIHYSVFLAFTAVLLLSRLLSDKLSLYEKLPYLFFFVVSTANLMFSTGRTGQLAFFVSLVLLIFLRFKVSLKSILLSALSVIMIFFIAYTTLDLFKKRIDKASHDIQRIENANYNSSFGIRVAFWLVAFEVLKEKPLFGDGIGDYKLATKEILEKKDFGLTPQTKEFMLDQHFHNQYLMVAVQGGLVGLTLMLLLLYQFFRLKIEERELKIASVVGFSVMVVSFVAEPLWMLQFPLTLFLFILSFSIVAAKKSAK